MQMDRLSSSSSGGRLRSSHTHLALTPLRLEPSVSMPWSTLSCLDEQIIYAIINTSSHKIQILRNKKKCIGIHGSTGGAKYRQRANRAVESNTTLSLALFKIPRRSKSHFASEFQDKTLSRDINSFLFSIYMFTLGQSLGSLLSQLFHPFSFIDHLSNDKTPH